MEEEKKEEKALGIKLREQTKVNVLQAIYQVGDVDSEKYRIEKSIGHVYRATLGLELGPAILFSPEPLESIGEQSIYVKKGTIFPGDYPIENADHARLLIGKDKKLQALVNGKLRSMGMREAACEALQESGISAYTVLQAVELEELQKLSKEEIDSILEDYVCRGYEVAPEIRSWGRAGLVHFLPKEESKDMAKYRGHTLIIKATKSGVTAIAKRTGKSLDSVNSKSVEGFANADGQITHSPLHNTYGAVNVDEFLREQVEDGLFQHMNNFLEMGQYETWKACRKIINHGAPRMTFTANPQDMQGVPFSKAGENSQTKIEGQESLVDEGLRKLMFATFKNGVAKLTQSASAAFSRLGLIIFNPSLKGCTLMSKENSKYFEERNGIAGSIVFWLSKKNREIFDRNINWLEARIKDYDKKLNEALAGCNDPTIRNAWAGQKDAYKHVRGQALSEAIIDNAYEIIQAKGISEELLAKIREDAEENLKFVVRINLESLGNILLTAKEFSKEPGVIRVEIDSSPGYVKPFLVAYALLVKKAPGGLVSWNTPLLQSAFEGMPLEKRKEVFGEEYAHWTHIWRRAKASTEKTKRITEGIFGKQIIQGEDLVLDSQIADLILSAYGMTQ